mmetsp:Transcript_25512/g.42429  ORF Transcript_25512/g.42429 Transcript_25512/m.42429 type:complete len:156 (-) Transcript_25512:382-849(-)
MSLRASQIMSSVPTSCIQVESTVINAPVATVWAKFRDLKLEGVAPSYVTKTEASGEGVGSVVTVHYKDETVWELRITEVSDRNYTIAYEVCSSTPAMKYSAAEGEIDIQKVTDGDATFLTWTTMFSNDADAQVMQDQKYKKLDFFADFKKAIIAE